MILTGKSISPGIGRGLTQVVDTRAVLATALKVPSSGLAVVELERLQSERNLEKKRLSR